MTSKEEVIEHGLKTISCFRNMLTRMTKDLKSGKVDKESQALIALKAMESFFAADIGFALWCDKVREAIAQDVARYKQLH